MTESIAEFAAFLRDTVRKLSGGPPQDEMLDDLKEEFVARVLSRPDLLRVGARRQGFHVLEALWLYYDPWMSISIGHAKAGPVAIHNHGTWEFIGVYRGEIDYQSYQVGSSEVGDDPPREDGQRVMRRGDVVLCPPPPNDVHSWTVLSDEAYLVGIIGPGLSPVRRYWASGDPFYIERDYRM